MRDISCSHQLRRSAARTILIALLLVATGITGHSQSADDPLVFVADLRGVHVAPAPVDTDATGRATAVLTGNRLTVHGSFTNLSSPLRDIETTPEDPGVHLHRGAEGETTPYFFGLRVQLNVDERSGVFFGTTELDEEQRALLLSNRLYIDIHTMRYGPGEVRDQWRPADPAAAARAQADTAPLRLARAAVAGSVECH